MRKGEKKMLARLIREHVGIPARTICRTWKNDKVYDYFKLLIPEDKKF